MYTNNYYSQQFERTCITCIVYLARHAAKSIHFKFILILIHICHRSPSQSSSSSSSDSESDSDSEDDGDEDKGATFGNPLALGVREMK